MSAPAALPPLEPSSEPQPAPRPSRGAGLLLFLPVPLVLWLFTGTPLGVVPSVVVGIAVMATHRLYARPWAVARAERRCLWCAGGARPGHALSVAEPGAGVEWASCSAAHRHRAAGLLGWADANAVPLRAGILGTLTLFLPLVLLAASGRLGPFTPADAVAFFRGGVALAVLPLGWIGARRVAPGATSAASPFPVHVPALVGLSAVTWLFRLVGIVWLAQAGRHLAGRF